MSNSNKESDKYSQLEATKLQLAQVVDDALDSIKQQIELEKLTLLGQINMIGSNLKIKDSKVDPAKVQEAMDKIRSRLLEGINSGSNPGILILEPSDEVMEIMGNIGSQFNWLFSARHEGPKHRKELAILSVLAGEFGSDDPVTIEYIALKTGYAESSVGAEIRVIHGSLEGTSWGLSGSKSVGWKLVRIDQQTQS